jgi:hypothetical protein
MSSNVSLIRSVSSVQVHIYLLCLEAPMLCPKIGLDKGGLLLKLL